jgi:predicted homoserine dehydrogenase-like protein
MINVVVIGVGCMGRGLVHQIAITPGLRCVGIIDKDKEKCEAVSKNYRVPSYEKMEYLLDAHADVVIDATSSILEAATFDVEALHRGRHLIMMNAEADLIFGPALMKIAAKNGVTYTSCDGDQPAVLAKLIDEVRYWGFSLVMTGNMKGFLDKYSNPEKIKPEADKRDLDYEQATAMTDGTKMNIEMSLVANAYDLKVPPGGMQGYRTSSVRDALELFDRDLSYPYVDYILDAEPGGGVFVIGRCGDPYQRRLMKYYKMGDGPNYLFYRPYHLCHVESMQCIVDAAEGKSLLRPRHGFVTNVYAYAKKDLPAGHELDGLGGYDCYGMIGNTTTNFGLPICLARGVKLLVDVKKDEAIEWGEVEIPFDRPDFELFQEALAAI